VDIRCGWYDSCRSVLVTRQVTTVWVNCFVAVRCGWNDVSPFDELTRWDLAPVITLSLFIFGLMTFWTATTFFIYFLFRPVLFYLRPCHCISVMRVCWFVCSSLMLRIFGMMSLKIGYRILNCFINLWSLVLVSIFRLGFPQVLFKVIFVAVIVSYSVEFVCFGRYFYRSSFVGVYNRISEKLGRCQMTQLN